MASTLLDELKNFPVSKGNAFECLQEIVNGKLQGVSSLKDKQKDRTQLELDIIKKTNTAKVFLLYDDIMSHLKDLGAVFHGMIAIAKNCILSSWKKQKLKNIDNLRMRKFIKKHLSIFQGEIYPWVEGIKAKSKQKRYFLKRMDDIFTKNNFLRFVRKYLG